MPDLYLHHYPVSPFAEKIRLILGFKQLAWKSVIVPDVSPKPDVEALTGGYRRTPVLQIGADIYCDTALICDVLEHIAPTPTLYPAGIKGAARIAAQWADSTLFWAAMGYSLRREGLTQLFAGAPPQVMQAFAEDRKKMSTGMVTLRGPDATAAYKSYLRRIASMLDEQDFLLGDAPCVADFSVYHPLWFTRTRVPLLADILAPTPGVLAWMDRMAAFGHGRMEKSNATESIAACAVSARAPIDNDVFQDEHAIALGSQVTIAAEAFGTEPTAGELVAATRMRYTLRRVDARAGTVHVHFPRIGFVLRKA